MTGAEIGFLSIAAILVLIYTGMHVPVAFCVVSLIGVWAIRGSFVQASTLMALAASDAISAYDFGVIPLFVLMGLLVSVADLGRDAFVAANALLGRVGRARRRHRRRQRGVRRRHRRIDRLCRGVHQGRRPRDDPPGLSSRVSRSGWWRAARCSAMLIPPSLLLIIYGLLAEQSIGDLFIAGIVPGLLLAPSSS